MKNQKQNSFSKDSIPSSVEWNQDKEKKIKYYLFCSTIQISFCPDSLWSFTVFYQLIKTFGCIAVFHVWVILAIFKIFYKKEAFYFSDFVLAANSSGVGSCNKYTIYTAYFCFSLIQVGLHLILQTNIKCGFTLLSN